MGMKRKHKQNAKKHPGKKSAQNLDGESGPPEPKKRKARGKASAKDFWLKGSLLARRDMFLRHGQKLPSVPTKGTEYYAQAQQRAEQLRSGEISPEQCASMLAQ